ncbi:uncharacterized protein LOC127285913 [Leptopilina boulardi]|uniref:uncharacterized protein LOC127285913 n=1 Tax=Leptopilina boulardi TaxID=63433 RepID=UPI0021F68EA1|nr:uncharacterized protein LOC127285913 [Leptopilina boulardi]
MMDDTSFFIQGSLNFQFLSVCHYINTLGLIFHNENLTTLDERQQTVSVLNALFQYLDNSNNEFEAKLELLKTILKGTDLYGGEKYERLDPNYVDETFQYIIKTTLFSHYENINMYLSGIINMESPETYSGIIQFIEKKFNEEYISNDYCLPAKESPILNLLSRKKVFLDYILPMFPKPSDENMKITDNDYIYAMAGSKIVRYIFKETLHASFRDYVFITQILYLQEYFKEKTYQILFVLFSTPALFFYEKYKNSRTEKFLNVEDKKLSSYLHLTMDKIHETPVNQLQIIDPVFELTIRLSLFGHQTFYKPFSFMLHIIPNDSMCGNLKMLLSSMVKKLKTFMEVPTTFNGLIQNVIGERHTFKIVQYYYPTSNNFFGPKCFIFSGHHNAELRTIEGNPFPVPVLPINYGVNKIYYLEYLPLSKKIGEVKLEIGKDDILRKIIPITTSNEYETPIKKMKPNPTENFNAPIEEPNLSFVDNQDTHRELNIRGGLPSDNIPGSSKAVLMKDNNDDIQKNDNNNGNDNTDQEQLSDENLYYIYKVKKRRKQRML